MRKMTFLSWRGGAVASLLAALALAGCGGGGGSAGTGTLSISMTDAPACGYDQVNVTVQKVRVNASASANDNDAGWTDIVLNPARRIDLLTLSNGVLTSLGQTPLPSGHYSQLRLVLAPNDSSHPLANSVIPSGASEVPLTVPSGVQSGIKLNADITIAANQVADFVLDFNACKSVVVAGASGNYLLKPVIAVTPNYASGVQGYVDTSVANGSTWVTLQQGGVVIKATAPDTSGHFVLQPVAPGTYDFVITAPNRASTVITGVPVTSGTVIGLSTQGSPLVPTVATMGTVSGTVTPPASSTSVDASVMATQRLANGDTVDMADVGANTVTGAYTLSLPASAPRVAAYVAAPNPYTFAADVVAGTLYSLSATSGATVKSGGTVTVTSGGTFTTNFTF